MAQKTAAASALQFFHTLRPRQSTLRLALLAAVIGAGLSAHAATLTWDPTATPTNPAGGTGTWDLTNPAWSNTTADQVWSDIAAAGADTAVFGGTAGTVTLNTNLSALGLQFLTTGYTISGTGVLILGAGGINAGTLVSGATTIGNNLVLGAAQSWNAGAGATLSVTGNVNNNGATLTATGAGNVTLSGALTGNGGIARSGTGTLTLSGANTYAGATNVNGGTVIFSGNTNNTTAVDNVGTVAASNATLIITSGSTFGANFVNSGQAYSASVNVSTNLTSAGAIHNNGGTFTVARQLGIGVTGYGAFSQTAGTTTVNGFIAVGGGVNGGVVNISGGTYTGTTVGVGSVTLGYGGSNAATYGVLNLSGTGSFIDNSPANFGVWVGEVNNGILNISDNANLTITSGGTVGGGGGLMLGKSNATTGNGIVNALGGTITTPWVDKGTGRGTFNFNGGTLKANAATTAFMTGLTNAYVYAGGATVDDGGFPITIGQPLLAPTGSGVSAAGLSVTGGGFIDTPIVTITGGGGTGATAVANVDANGNLTGITITNPGVGYTSAPTFALVGGGQGNSGAITGTPTLVANTSGGFTKLGAGITTLTGASTYAGPTTVNAGQLVISGGGSINNSSSIAVNNGGKLVHIGSAPVSPTVTINSGGTLDGTGTLNAVNVNGGGIITNGNGSTSALTIGALTFNSNATLNFNVGSTAPVLNTTTLTTSAGGTTSTGKITINATNSTNIWTAGTYDLISYSSLPGVGFSDFIKGTIAGLSGRQSATLTNPSGFIAVTIAGDNPKWTGALNGNWTTASLAAPKNWALITSGDQTDFIVGDIVLFDDSATGTGAVSISDADVAPAAVVFNNAGKAYAINGPFGIAGAGTVALNGSGTVDLNTASTYSGGTTLNAGTLDINNASAIGTGTLTINRGTLDNTSGAPVALTTANAQVWNSDITFTGSNDLNLGTGAVNMTASRTITTNGSANLTVAGPISGVGFNLTKAGSGTLTFSGTNTYTGSTIVDTGTLAIAGGVTGTLAADVQISPNASDNAIVTISGGVLNANRLILGGNSNNDGTPGDTATLIQTGGTINSAQWFTVGSGVTTANSAPVGEYDISGNAVLNVITQQLEVANFTNSSGTVNMSGNAVINIENNANIALGANANALNGTFNQNGGTVTFYSDAGSTIGGTGILYLGKANSLAGVYTYNLNGGSLIVPQISQSTGANGGSSGGTGVFNFNGGTLKAAKANANFMSGITTAAVMAGGAIIDDGGFAVTIPQTLSSGAGNDGGLTKLGTGTLTLSAANTYAGPTTVNAGRLLLSGTGSINNSSGIAINNGGKLTQISSTTITPTITINSGTLAGSNAAVTNVVVAGPGIVANGNNDAGVLTISSLSFNAAGTINVTLPSPNATAAPGIVVTNLATSGGAGSSTGLVTINAANSVWNNGVYDLVGYSSLAGPGFSDFVLGTVTGLTPRQTGILTNISGEIALTVSGGAIPVWTGALNDNWTTAVLGAPKNWQLQTAGTTTDFLTGDTVLFDDSAANANVNIADANVSPTSTTFNNSTLNYTLSSTGGFGIATGFLVKSGTGSLTINTANTYAGGTTLNAGTLDINNASAIGTGALTINGGAIDNTSGAAIALTTKNLVSIAGDFTFTGTNSLSLGTGNVTLGGAGTVRTINVTAGTLTMGAIPTATGYGLTKTGPGTLALGNAASNITGDLNVAAGTLQIGANDFHAGGLAGSGTIENGSNTSRWLYINNAADDTFSGVLQNGAGTGRLGLSKSGAGALTLIGKNTYTDTTTVAAGKLILPAGAAINANNSTSGNGVVIVSGTANPILNITGGTLNAGDTNAPSLQAGGGNGTAGAINISSGTIAAPSELWLATADGGYGFFNQTGGTVSFGSWLALGRGGGQGVLDVSGGSLSVTGNNLTIGSVGGAAGITHGLATFSGNANVSVPNGAIFVGENTNGILNIRDNAAVSASAATGVVFSNAAANTGILNLSGGTLSTGLVKMALAGTSTFNFNGGTLKASTSNANFMTGLSNTYVYSGGATIDDGGNAITIAQPLIAPTGNGVTAAGLTFSGGGYIGEPVVTISGDGTGATAVANVDASGNLIGVTITNPGVGYTNASFSVSGGGVGATGVISGSPTLVANVGGGLTKTGTGTLTLSGANTYTGDTTVNNGTLLVNSGTGSGNVVLNAGTLGGTGTISGAILAGSGPHAISPGAAGAVGTLTATGLTTNSGTTFAFDLTAPASGTTPGIGDLLNVTGSNALTLNGGKLAILSSPTGQPSLGYYQAVEYSGTVSGLGIHSITLPAASAQGIAYTLDILHDPGFIDIHRGLLGDANDDGIVDGTDLGILATDFNASNVNWSAGDFNGDGIVDGTDLGILATYFNSSVGSSFAQSLSAYPTLLTTYTASVPEPAALSLLGLGTLTLVIKRRTKC